ncbi:MAG TPA: sugar-binding protein, partial [Planctomycetota bacterium]|nr:sugar-binding protein [Planctomycetota bacterium]
MIALLFLGPSAITPGANAAGQHAVPSIAVPEVVGPAPKIDGVPDEAFWRQAASSGDFRLPDGKLPVTKARWQIARQGRTIYLAVECFADAKALASLKGDVKEHDSRQIWQDDEVELFIDPSGHRRSYYHVMINCAGTTTDTFRPYFREADIWWNPPYQSATKVGEKRWVVEMALPLSIFDRTKEFAKEW